MDPLMLFGVVAIPAAIGLLVWTFFGADDTTITATAPAHAPGNVVVSVTTVVSSLPGARSGRLEVTVSASADFRTAADSLRESQRATLRVGTIQDPESIRLGPFVRSLATSSLHAGGIVGELGLFGTAHARRTRMG